MRRRIYLTVRKLLSYCFYFLPIKKDKIVFINFNGRGYGCNPKYIAEEIIKQGLEYDLVWLVSDLDISLPKQIRKALFREFSGLYEIATAKVIITNVKNDLFLVKKRGQYVIQTWHGSYSSKLLEKEAEDKLSPRYIRESKKNSKQTDLFLSNSKALSKSYRDAFWCECEILECGLPRNDMLFPKNEQEVKRRIRNEAGVSQIDKLVLYAPTFRDDGSTEVYNIDCDGILNVLGDEWKVLIRLHPNVDAKNVNLNYSEKIIDASSYPDMQELLMIADILITDYSSSIFEFSVLGKPSYIFASDIDEYQQMRGLNENFFNMPYKVCRTNSELLEELKKYTPSVGQEAANQFIEMVGGIDKGDASQIVVERIRTLIDAD